MALILVVVLRPLLSDFLNAISGRVQKLSVFSVSIDLVAARPAAETPLLDEIKVTSAYTAINESSSRLIEQAQVGQPVDYALIALGEGKEWISSRLFIACVMMERMRGVKIFVFVRRKNGSDNIFLAAANTRQLRWALVQRNPWLEIALMKAEQDVFGYHDPKTSDNAVIANDTGAFNPRDAAAVFSRYLQGVQDNAVGIGCIARPGWLSFPLYQERAEWVTPDLLASLVPDSALKARVELPHDAAPKELARAVLQADTAFVARVAMQGEFVKLYNRQRYLEEVARSVSYDLR